MVEPSLSLPDLRLATVDEKLAKGAHSNDRNGQGLEPEKRKVIEDLIRKGRSLNSIAFDTASSKNTVAIIRDQLIEREPDLFKAHMAQSLKRVANKTVATIEKGIDAMDEAEVKPGMLTALSVTAGILLDKLAQVSGDPQVQVVEHRLKIDAGTVSGLIKSAPVENAVENAIEVKGEVLDVTPSE